MWELYSAVGFGQKPQLGFPGAVTGRLRPYKTWRPIEQATMSYGYGLSASLFQIAHAYTVFAHDGELIPVTLTRPLGAPAAGRRGMRVISPKTARGVRDMLQLVTPARRHRAQGADHGLLGRRQDRHRVQAGGQGLRDQEVPRLVRRHGADRAIRASSSR